MNKTKFVIVGGSASRELAPYDDKESLIVGLNEMEYPGRVDIYFEMHPMSVQNDAELEWLKKCRKPIYVLNKADAMLYGIKNPIEYPFKEIIKQPWAIQYFTCTMAYQIALAIHQDFKTIGLWGLRMDIGSPRERTIESAAIQWWLGIAKGRGIEIIWDEHPARNRLLYGYDYWDEIERVDNWLYCLNTHITYRLGGRHVFVGGDGDPIRNQAIKKRRKK